MKTLLIIALAFASMHFATAQVYLTATGETRFFSKTPVEDIAAVNNKTGAVLNAATGDIAVKMTMTDFVFPNKLMQEHFNENYMESEKFPTGIFRGKIQEKIDFSRPGTHEVSSKGTFEIHGVKQDRTLKGTLTIEADRMTLVSGFSVALADHKIDVPKIVFVKVAQNIDVKTRYVLTQKKP